LVGPSIALRYYESVINKNVPTRKINNIFLPYYTFCTQPEIGVSRLSSECGKSDFKHAAFFYFAAETRGNCHCKDIQMETSIHFKQNGRFLFSSFLGLPEREGFIVVFEPMNRESKTRQRYTIVECNHFQ
jgi:hypothetical protein